ncbi:hypothetical protein DXG03_004001, partial [Asterophora parasitica]
SPGRRYRSINEFIPHAIWLYEDATMNPANCLCKYCQKRPQKEVTASMAPGILQTTHSTPTPSRPRVPRPKAARVPQGIRGKVYAAVQKTPIPTLSKSAHVHHKATMLVERNSDLRAASSKTSMKLQRWFRTGELLWCALNPTIKGSNNVAIEFWPGLVDEVKLKTAPIPHHADAVTDDAKNATPWSIRQSTQYRLQLLGVNHSILVSDDQVLPYQAHAPPNELIQALKAFPTHRLNFDREILSRFNPCPKDGTPNFDHAVAAYAMAVQIGLSLSGYWCLTDEWAFEYTAPTIKASAPPEPSASQGPTSLQAVNANNMSISSGPSSQPNSYLQPYPPSLYYPNISGPTSDMTPADVQRLSARMVGKVASPPAGSPPLTQMRFQGVWWGAERIWVDEFIRLKVPRRCIAPKGAEHILAPAGPGKSAREVWLKKGMADMSEIGAGARGVFMRLDGLFVVDAVQYDGTLRKECRASGMLYELADDDWEDPDAIKNTLAATDKPIPSAENDDPASRPANPEPAAVVDTIPPIPNPPLPSSQLSHPSSSSRHHLPEAPDGYVFRPILTEGHEAVLSLSMISGRYYPRILSHPLLETTLNAALSNPLENGGLLESNNLWALEGLSAGFHNSVDPIQYKTSRTKMVEDADTTAMKELETHKQETLRELDGTMDDVMEVDP